MCPLLYEWGHGLESQSAGWEELERNLGFVWEKLAVSMLVSQTPVTDSKLKWTFYLQQEARVAASQAEQTQLLAKPAQPYLWLLHGHTANLWELEFFNSVTSKSVWIFKVKCFFFTPLKWNYHKIWIIFFILQDKKKAWIKWLFPFIMQVACEWDCGSIEFGPILPGGWYPGDKQPRPHPGYRLLPVSSYQPLWHHH